MNPFDEHHIDRDLSRTGLSIMVITPGVGYFNVDKTMLRLTTERLLDAGFTIDMVCMSQIPLHVTPLFSYWSRPLPPPKKDEERDHAGTTGEFMAELSADSRGRFSSTRMHDLLYWDVPDDGEPEQLIFCESRGVRQGTLLTPLSAVSPLLYCHFYSKSHDRPFKEDRFIPRCKMYEIQMLGLIDHDLTTLALPTLDEDEMAAKAAADAQNLEDEHDAFDESLFISAFTKPVEPKTKKTPTTPMPERTILEVAEVPKLQSSPVALAEPSPLSTPKPDLPRPVEDMEAQHASTRDRQGQETEGSGHRQFPAANDSKPDSPESSRPDSLAPRSRSATVNVADLQRSPASTIVPDFGRPGDRNISRATAHSELDKQAAGGTFSAPGTPPAHALKGKSSKSSLAGLTGASKFFSYLMGRTSINQLQPVEATVTKENVSFDKLDRSASSSSRLATPTKSLENRGTPAKQSQRDASEPPSVQKRPLIGGAGYRERTDSLSKVEPMAIPLNRARNSDTGKRVKRPPKKPTYRQKEDEEQREQPPKGSQAMNRSQPEHEVGSKSWQSAQASSWKHREAVRKGEYWRINPCQPRDNNVSKNGRHRRWQFSVARPTFTQDVKWDSIIAPCCLPLTTDLIPMEEELRSQYHEQLYHFACDANQLSFLLRADELSDLPIAVMREMASQRLSRRFSAYLADIALIR